ncbi:hypothetical protein V5O48_001560 [Marasmius crinis-equi]|uniref:Uncharacterized protein n=1 Tax=Marasmius crinis-equi TaxID=585013 RepID=A0ABR3FY71_9AGAR
MLRALLLAPLFCGCLAYIPAYPSNSTDDGNHRVSLNATVNDPTVHLQWYTNGSFITTVSYALAGNSSRGVNQVKPHIPSFLTHSNHLVWFFQGALVHFSEDFVNNTTNSTNTPWIALVPCDQNATNASQDLDIFTLARDKGAVAVLLYALYSSNCILNPGYNHTAPPLDIFTSPSLTTSRLIEYQFGQLGNVSVANYDPSHLDEGTSIVNSFIQDGSKTAPGYLFATLNASNAATAHETTTPAEGADGKSTGSGLGRSRGALATIVT